MSVVETSVETAVQPVTRRDVLHRAADLLEEFGWGQAGDIDAEPFMRRIHGVESLTKPGPYCVGTAMQEAAYDLGIRPVRGEWPVFAEASDALLAVLALLEPRELVRWNDQPGRTRAEVIARLREAADQGAA